MNDAVTVSALPFDARKLDDLLDRAGIDALIVTSKHNLQYLIGGYRFFFFDQFDAAGITRYLPVLVYRKGRPEQASYIGNPMERYERDLDRFWIPDFRTAWHPAEAVRLAADHLKRLGLGAGSIGVERSFLPVDASEAVGAALPDAKFVEAQGVLESLRAQKTPEELHFVREASERVVESMLAVIAGHGPGVSKRALTEALRQEEVRRGLNFEYCLITAGTNLNRAPTSDQIWGEGDILSLDSGGNYKGYIGDLCRMAIQGEPDSELEDFLAEIDEIQQAARKPIRAGARGGDVLASAEEVLRRSPHGNLIEFVAHGMGLITHEAPRLVDHGPFAYPADHAELPLLPGMVISIETTLPHPKRGFVKLEDTVAVTADGWEAFGDGGRGWNRGGTAAQP